MLHQMLLSCGEKQSFLNCGFWDAPQEIMQREQCMLMGELAQFVNALEHRSDLTGTTVEHWTMGQYMDHVFPVGVP